MRLFILMLILLSNSLLASEYNRDFAQVKNVTNLTNINGVQNSGIAMAIASGSIDCSRTDRWQAGAGFGNFNDSTALALGGCKRFNDTLIKLTGSKDSNNTSVGFSINFTLD